MSALGMNPVLSGTVLVCISWHCPCHCWLFRCHCRWSQGTLHFADPYSQAQNSLPMLRVCCVPEGLTASELLEESARPTPGQAQVSLLQNGATARVLRSATVLAMPAASL